MSKILQKMIVLKIHEILTVLIFFLTNSPLSFQNTRDVSNGLSDFDKMVVSVKMTFQKILLGRAYTMKFFFDDLEIFVSKEKCRNISASGMCAVQYYSVCSHNQVSFIRL